MSLETPRASQLTDDLEQLSARLGWQFSVAAGAEKDALPATRTFDGAGIEADPLPATGPFADTDVILLRRHLAGRRRLRGARSVL
jgi:hypothetical protein